MIGNNLFLTTNPGSADFPMASTTKKMAFSFKPRQSSDIVNVSVRCYKAGTCPTFRIGIQGDNAGSPDGTFKQSATFNTTAISASWKDVAITAVSVTAGTKYWIVIEYVSGTIDGSNKFFVCCLPGSETRNPYNLADYGMGLKTTNSASWDSENYTGIFMCHDGVSKVEGQPYHEQAWGTIYAARYRGEVIVPDVNMSLQSITARVSAVGTPGGDLNYKIIKKSDMSTLQSGVFGTALAIGAEGLGFTKTLPSPVALTACAEYAIVFYTTGGNSSNCYQYYRLSLADTTLELNSYYGVTCYAYISDNTGSSYVADHSFELWLTWTLVPPAPPIKANPVKIAYSGFHCFIRQAIDNLKLGGSVVKNPNNNEVF